MNKRKFPVFFSWQSQLDNLSHRQFIQESLDDAARQLGLENYQIEPVIDRDTLGLPGAPDFINAIFSKIDGCEAFAADVSIVRKGSGRHRPCPNANVLLEVGYALRSVGWKKILLIFDLATGKPEQLPADLNKHLLITYDSRRDLAGEKLRLIDSFKRSIGPMLQLPLATSALPVEFQDFMASVEQGRPDLRARAKSLGQFLAMQLSDIAPDLNRVAPDLDEALLGAIQAADQFLVLAFRAMKVTAETGNPFALQGFCDGFAESIDLMNRHRTGAIYSYAKDFWLFIGHELFAGIAGLLYENRRLDMIQWFVTTPLREGMSIIGKPFWPSQYTDEVYLLENLPVRLGKQVVSQRAQLLRDRHSSGPLAELVPFPILGAGDHLMGHRYLADNERNQNIRPNWVPWTSLWAEAGLLWRSHLYSKSRVQELQFLMGFGGEREAWLRQFRRYCQALKSLWVGKSAVFYDSPFDDIADAEIGKLP